MDHLLPDLRPAIRLLHRAPAFTAAAVLTLGLGIGANTAIFSVIHAVLLETAPYPQPERLATLHSTMDATKALLSMRMADYVDIRTRAKTLEDVAILRRGESLNLTGTGQPERVIAASVTPSLFSTLKTQPMLGRALRNDEIEPGKHRVAVVSHGFWHNRLAGRADVLSTRIELNGQSFAVVGVMPPGFDIPDTRTEVFYPLVVPTEEIRVRIMARYQGYVRLAPGATVTTAQAELDSIARDLAREYPRTNTTANFVLTALQENRSGPVRAPMLALMGTAVLVMLIACANVANLLLVRATGRGQEMAIRAAMGASRFRLARQIWLEILVINAGGWLAGLLIGSIVLRSTLALAPEIPGIEAASVNAPVLLFAAGLTLLTSLLIGLAPVSLATGADANSALRQRGETGASPWARRIRSGLAVAEIAICVVLLTGAALLLRSFQALLEVDTGIRPEGVTTLRIALPVNQYKNQAAWRAFQERLLERASSQPGVASAAIISKLPFDGTIQTAPITIQGKPDDRQNNDQIDVRFVSPDYFSVVGVRLLQGRQFSTSDNTEGAPVVIIDDLIARRYFGNENPLGRALKLGSIASTEPWRVIVGVVNTVLNDGPDRRNRGQVYFNYGQATLDRFGFVAKAKDAKQDLGPALREAVRSIDSNQAVFEVRPLADLLGRTTQQRRFSLVLMSLFAATALILAAIGVYAVISWGVSQRTREIGVRMALGADFPGIVRMILGEAGRVALLGTVVGLAGAAALSATMRTMLFQIGAFDPAAFGIAASVVLLATLLAAALPARRAATLAPYVAIRTE